MKENFRDEISSLKKIGVFKKTLLGLSYYCPISFGKKIILKLLGAQIGSNVYFGLGTLFISSDYSNVIIGDNVFISPGVLIKVNDISIGNNTHIGYQSLLVGDILVLGKRCNINNRVFIESEYCPIIIEDDVTIAASVIISSHDGAYKQAKGQELKKGVVKIMNHAFIGNHATILPAVTIGERAIVGAGAVVTKDVDDDSVVAGVPAKII